jgi:hypothetical protein
MERFSLMSQSEYARKTEKSRQLVHYYVRKELLETTEVSGTKFIKIPKDGSLPQPLSKTK